MDGDKLSLTDLLTSDGVIPEMLYGLLKAHDEHPDWVWFSDAFSTRPDPAAHCHWIAIPKAIIADVQPLGYGYCRDVNRLPAPMRYPYVRLLLRKPQDQASIALADLLSSALRKLAATSAVSHEERKPIICHKSTQKVCLSTHYSRDPDGCPPNIVPVRASELYERINRYTSNVYVYNFSDETIICTMKYNRFQDGQLVSDYCVDRRIEVAPRSHELYGQVTNDPDAEFLTAEFLDLWNAEIRR